MRAIKRKKGRGTGECAVLDHDRPPPRARRVVVQRARLPRAPGGVITLLKIKLSIINRYWTMTAPLGACAVLV